jgi:rhamnogalacturonan endolyase
MLRQLFTIVFVFLLTLGSYVNGSATARGQPYLIKVNDQTHVIGNDLWNLTIGRSFGTRLLYKGIDLVGNASGHYVSYSMPRQLYFPH